MNNKRLFVVGLICIPLLSCSLDGNSCNYNHNDELNQFQCRNSIYYECQADGLWDEGEKCAHGCNLITDTCNPECLPETKKCEEDISYSCKEDGYWGAEQTCEYGCHAEDMTCNECITGTSDIPTDDNGHDLAQNCINGKWVITDCYPNYSDLKDKIAICISNCTIDNIFCEDDIGCFVCTNNSPFPDATAYMHDGPFYGKLHCITNEEKCYSDGYGAYSIHVCNSDSDWELKQKCDGCDENRTCVKYPG